MFDYKEGETVDVTAASNGIDIAYCSCDISRCEAYSTVAGERLLQRNICLLDIPCDDVSALLAFVGVVYAPTSSVYFRVDPFQLKSAIRGDAIQSLSGKSISKPMDLTRYVADACDDAASGISRNEFCQAVGVLGKDAVIFNTTINLPPLYALGSPEGEPVPTAEMRRVAAVASGKQVAGQRCTGSLVLPYFDESATVVFGWYRLPGCGDQVYSFSLVNEDARGYEWVMSRTTVVEPQAARVISLLRSGRLRTWEIPVGR